MNERCMRMMIRRTVNGRQRDKSVSRGTVTLKSRMPVDLALKLVFPPCLGDGVEVGQGLKSQPNDEQTPDDCGQRGQNSRLVFRRHGRPLRRAEGAAGWCRLSSTRSCGSGSRRTRACRSYVRTIFRQTPSRVILRACFDRAASSIFAKYSPSRPATSFGAGGGGSLVDLRAPLRRKKDRPLCPTWDGSGNKAPRRWRNWQTHRT
jgi:hypothetical protein